jgi:hypothetical protein
MKKQKIIEKLIKLQHYVSHRKKIKSSVLSQMPSESPPANIRGNTMIIILLIFSSILWTVHNDHMVLEEIREMTSAISYIHLVLPVDITVSRNKLTTTSSK